jgi:hypothetical protein
VSHIHRWTRYNSLDYKAEFGDVTCAAVVPVVELIKDQEFDVQEAAASSLSELAKYRTLPQEIFVT